MVSAIQNSENKLSNSEKSIMVGYVWSFDDIGGCAITNRLLNLLYKHFHDYKMNTLGGSSEARSYNGRY